MTSPKLTLTETVHATLLRHARNACVDADNPIEVCGILAGTRDSSTSTTRVTECYHVENVAADTRTAYELDPAETLERFTTIENSDSQVVGFYHSHPESPASPSPTDREQAHWPGYVYLICSVPAAEVGAWRWTGTQFEPLDIEIVTNTAESTD